MRHAVPWLAMAFAAVLAGLATARAEAPAGDRGQVAQIAAGGPQTPAVREPADGLAWTVVVVEGQAHVLSDDGQSVGWMAVREGQVLPSNAQIETGADGRVLLFNGNDAITVGAETRLALLETTAESDRVEIFQDMGTADYQVEDRSDNHGLSGFLTGVSQLFGGSDGAAGDRFEVRAPYLTTVVKGTAFTVTVQRGRTDVRVRDGVVEVRDPRSGDAAEIVAGQNATGRTNSAAGVQVGTEANAAADASPKAPHGSGSNANANANANANGNANGNGNGNGNSGGRGDGSGGSSGSAASGGGSGGSGASGGGSGGSGGTGSNGASGG